MAVNQDTETSARPNASERGSRAKQHNVLGTYFSLWSYRDVIAAIQDWRQNQERHYVTLTPPYSVVMCRRDRQLRRATQQAHLTLPDGVGILLAARLLGYPHQGRVTGPALMLRLCDTGRGWGARHFFYGGWPGVADRLATRLTAEFPGLTVAGTYCPPFRELSAREDAEVVQYINGCRPDIVWVGLGSPKQEKWMAQHVGEVNAAALIDVSPLYKYRVSGRGATRR